MRDRARRRDSLRVLCGACHNASDSDSDATAAAMVKLVVTNREGATLEVGARRGYSIMENIRDLPASVEAICGGMCACSTCHVLVDPEWTAKLPPRRYEEQVMLQDLPSFDPARSRLSCQVVVTDVLDGLRLTIAPEEY